MNRIEQRLLAEPGVRAMFEDFGRWNREREEASAKADPKGHKLSRVTTNASYRYWPAGQDGRGRDVRFCWTTHRNVAGYFLGWREVASKAQVKRDRWVARKSKAAVVELARRRQNAFIDQAAK